MPVTGGRARHDARNLGIGLLNTLPFTFGLGALTASVALTVEKNSWGLLGALSAPGWIDLAAGLILLDLWMYLWHVINHKMPLLWRFHRMHHSDNRLDASSAVRFHLGEVLLSFVLRLGIIAILGLSIRHVVLYELVLIPVILVHHANIALPRPLEAVARWLVVTPDVHHVHHSRVRAETDSNYGSVLPWWDRLFRAFRMQVPEKLRYGLDGWDDGWRQAFRGLLLTPFLSTSESAPTERTGTTDQAPGSEVDAKSE